jgi:hypothetical protein
MTPTRTATSALLLLALAGCATSPAPVVVRDLGPNAVSLWTERAAATIALPPSPAGTPQERRPMPSPDMATLHLAIHEAVGAAPAASQEAAVHAAGYAVLKALYPQRSAQYQEAYDKAIAALPAGPAKDEGLRIGAERATRVVAERADDGRWADVPPVAAGTAPGAFRGVNPINQNWSRLKPFALTGMAQFRASPPPALDSAEWARDVAETKARGGEGSPATAREDEDARFHSEPPPRFWARNIGRFARSQPTLAENAKLMALLWVTQSDALATCFETKYAYYRWRPMSVINASDPAWKPRLPTPNHPEYPAAHGCATAAFAQNIADWYGTRAVTYRFDSTVTNTTHEWTDTEQHVAEVREARIVGGMHLRTSNLAGEKLGREVARWVGQKKFGLR